MAEPLVYRRSRLATAALVVGTGVMSLVALPLGALVLVMATALWQDSVPSGAVLGLGGASLLALPFLLVPAVRRAWRDRRLPLVTLDDEALTLHSRPCRVGWREIAGARLTYLRGHALLVLAVHQPERFLSSRERWFSDELWIGLGLLKGSPGELLAEVERRYRAAT